MKKLMTLGLLVLAFLFVAPNVSAQNAKQKEMMKTAKQETAQLAEKLDLDDMEQKHVMRYIYNYHSRMEERANPTEYSKPLSKEKINKRLFANLKNVLTADQLTQFRSVKDDLIKVDTKSGKKAKSMKTRK